MCYVEQSFKQILEKSMCIESQMWPLGLDQLIVLNGLVVSLLGLVTLIHSLDNTGSTVKKPNSNQTPNSIMNMTLGKQISSQL